MKLHKRIHKKIPKELMRVTPLSKTVAAIVFITLPFVGFLFGVQYGRWVQITENGMSDQNYPITRPKEVVCTMDAKICPDGTAVGRHGPMCQFDDCPLPGVDKIDVSNDSMSSMSAH